MKKLSNTLLKLQKEIKNSNKKIILVGPINLTKVFALECSVENKNLYNRIICFMDDKYDGYSILDKPIKKFQKLDKDNLIYYIISSSENGMFVMYKKLIKLKILDKNIFIENSINFITKQVLKNFNIKQFNIIECGAFGGTGQIFKMAKTLKDKMKTYAFEADTNEIKKLKKNSNSKYYLFNKIIDSKESKERTLYRISKNGAWTFHKPNKKLIKNYSNIYTDTEVKVFEKHITDQTISIDSISKEINKTVDYIYINIDSAEYYALKGAKNTLEKKKASVLEIEVYFEDFYKEQPLFGKIDELMREYGYELLKFRNPNLLVPTNSPFEIDREKLIHYNAIYTHNQIDTKNIENSLKHVSILELLGFPLKAFELLKKIYISNNREELEKVISSSYNKYSKIYNSTMTLESFLNKKDL